MKLRSKPIEHKGNKGFIYHMPLTVVILFLLTVAEVDLSGGWLPSLFVLLNLISLSGAGCTSLLLRSFHAHSPEVTAAFSVLPILTQISTLNKIAAAWLQHDPSLQWNIFYKSKQKFARANNNNSLNFHSSLTLVDWTDTISLRSLHSIIIDMHVTINSYPCCCSLPTLPYTCS